MTPEGTRTDVDTTAFQAGELLAPATPEALAALASLGLDEPNAKALRQPAHDARVYVDALVGEK